jgi:RNA polymerase sigma factor (sigma-70 family)
MVTEEEIGALETQHEIRRALRRLGFSKQDLDDLQQDVSIIMLKRARADRLTRQGLYSFALEAGRRIRKARWSTKERRLRAGYIEIGPDEVVEGIDKLMNPEENMSAMGTVTCIISTIEDLPLAEREAAGSHFLEETAIREIADLVGKPQRSVRAAVYRARWKIAEKLEQHGRHFTKRRTGQRCKTCLPPPGMGMTT